MVRLGATAVDFEQEIHQRCTKTYDLLMKCARPVLQHGTQEEVAFFNFILFCMILDVFGLSQAEPISG